jgi:hypothetical protein
MAGNGQLHHGEWGAGGEVVVVAAVVVAVVVAAVVVVVVVVVAVVVVVVVALLVSPRAPRSAGVAKRNAPRRGHRAAWRVCSI